MKLLKLSDLVSVEEALWVPSVHCTDLPACRGVYTPLQHSASGFVGPGTGSQGTQSSVFC